MNRHRFTRPALAACALLLAASWAAAQPTPDQAADMLLGSARRAFNEKNFPFAAARDAFDARVKGFDPDKPPPTDLEWAARARCDQAEMLLRLNKPKEAQAAAAPFTKELSLAKSRYHALGLYYHGFASYLTKDY